MKIDDKYKSPYEDYEWEEGYDVWESGFAKGMQCMLDKVMDLLEDCEIFDRLGRRLVKVEDFKKALEE